MSLFWSLKIQRKVPETWGIFLSNSLKWYLLNILCKRSDLWIITPIRVCCIPILYKFKIQYLGFIVYCINLSILILVDEKLLSKIRLIGAAQKDAKLSNVCVTILDTVVQLKVWNTLVNQDYIILHDFILSKHRLIQNPFVVSLSVMIILDL